MIFSLLWSLLFAGSSALAQGVAPRIAGVELGSTERNARMTLGAPDRVHVSLGMKFWDYQRRGLTVIWRDDVAGVSGFVVSGAAAGDVAGVTIGDSESVMRNTLGEPARVRKNGRFRDYVTATWVLSVELSDGRVVQVTLMRAIPMPQDGL